MELVPWIYGSRDSQAQHYVGFDCADLAVAAANAAGHCESYTNANGLAGRDDRGGSGELYMNGSTVKKASDGSDANVSIGTGTNDLHIGDLIMIDHTDDGVYDHTTLLYEDAGMSGVLDGSDKVIYASRDGGVVVFDLDDVIPSATPHFVLRVGWPN